MFEDLPRGQGLLLALSGGPDSVYLFHRLRELRDEGAVDFHCAHLHHGIRREADDDLRFVADLCRKYQVPLHTRRVDAVAYGKKMGLGTEEAGRKLRYDFFEEVARPGDWIALAHHRDDQVETILMRLIRGTGLAGLSGMRTLEGRRYRPLLSLTKREILEALEAEGQAYVLDHTNEEPIYTRNILRLELLPQIRALNPAFDEALLRLSAQGGEAQGFLASLAESWCAAHGSWAGESYVLDRSLLAGEARAVQMEVLRRALELFRGDLREITARHLDDLAKLITNTSGRSLDLPGVLAVASFDQLLLRPQGEERDELVELALREGRQKFGDFLIAAGPFTGGTGPWVYHVKSLQGLRVRGRRDGDRMALQGGGHKRIKEVFQEAQVPRGERDGWPLITRGSEVLWVPGLRKSKEEEAACYTITVIREI
ncbi:MAG: tRNA lysidine(34) synthetase TilS [Tissierellia bacterium]|nr:tRNA lysidine(34) synthetase TilS [Tissierellia bacterium]